MKNRLILSLIVLVFLVTNVQLAAAATTGTESSSAQKEPTPQVTEPAPMKKGFVNEDGKRFFYDDKGVKFVPEKAGVYLKNQKYYYFRADGSVYLVDKAKKVKFKNGKYYYFNADDSLYTKGWKTIDEKKYYFTKNGAAVGWKNIGSYRYYFNDYGVKFAPEKAGVYMKNKKYYYFRTSGSIYLVDKAKKVKFKNGKYYYFNANDSLYTKGWKTINGKKYYFTKNGAATGWKNIGSYRYYFNDYGVKFAPKKAGVYLKNKKYYYFRTSGSIYLVDKAKKVKFKNGKYYYFNANDSLYTKGWKTINKKKHYFTKNGAAVGWKKIGSYRYYFNSAGIMKTNTIVGKYYVNEKGRRVTEAAAMNAVKLVNKVSKNKTIDTKAEKLKACYDYIKRYPYERSYENPTSRGSRWYSYYANYIFTKKKGNCYKYASAFAYCAKVLGYDSRVAVGKIWQSPHGWAEIKADTGKIYIYDPNMQRNYPRISSWKRTYKTAPYPYTKYRSYKIVL